LEVFQRPLNVCRLFSFVAAAEKQYAFPAYHRVIDPVARSPIDPQFAYTLSQRLTVAKVPGSQLVDSGRNLRLCAGVCQLRQPIVEDIFSGVANLVANLYD